MKIYRKQVLKEGNLSYLGSTFPITSQYLDEVVNAFNDSAMGSVPFQMADASNTHTEDPERRRGTVRALHRTKEGLDATIELDDTAAAMVQNYPDFGVSVLIKHSRETGEGKFYPAVLAHVLGTLDPVLTTLEPWREEIAASHSGRRDLLTQPNREPWIGLAQPTQEDPMRHYIDYYGNTTAVPETSTRSGIDGVHVQYRNDPGNYRPREDLTFSFSDGSNDVVAYENDSPYQVTAWESAAETIAREEFLDRARAEGGWRTGCSWRDHSAKGSDLQNRADERQQASRYKPMPSRVSWGGEEIYNARQGGWSEPEVVYRGADPDLEAFLARAKEQGM